METYTLDDEPVDLFEFMEVNLDALTDHQIYQIAGLKPGEELKFGGGAAPIFTLRRTA